MTPLRQIIKHDPEAGQWGDCQRTCIAVIMDLEAEDVPHFCDGHPARADKRPWDQQQAEWLALYGLSAATFAYSGGVSLEQVMTWTSKQNPRTPMMLAGRSSLGCNHVVVVLDGEIVCDPSGNGIVGPTTDNTWEVSVLAVRAAKATPDA